MGALFSGDSEPAVSAGGTCLPPRERKSDKPAPNLVPGLIPPSGAWRGTTNGGLPKQGPFGFKKEYGLNCHIYRTFCTPRNWQLKEGTKRWVQRGGILWYNIQPVNWAKAASAEYDEHIANYASEVGSLAPAQVMVCVGHEPDGHMEGGAVKTDVFGTADEYKAMWRNFVDKFTQMGVTNVVWVMDYSRGIHKEHGFKSVVQLWPGDDIIGWVFFNCFGCHPSHKKRFHYTTIVSGIIDKLTEASGPGHDFLSKPWGIGAHAPKDKCGDGTPMTTEDRVLHFKQIAESMNDPKFEKIKAYVYYSGQVISDDIRPSYTEFIQLPNFVELDGAIDPDSEDDGAEDPPDEVEDDMGGGGDDDDDE